MVWFSHVDPHHFCPFLDRISLNDTWHILMEAKNIPDRKQLCWKRLPMAFRWTYPWFSMGAPFVANSEDLNDKKENVLIYWSCFISSLYFAYSLTCTVFFIWILFCVAPPFYFLFNVKTNKTILKMCICKKQKQKQKHKTTRSILLRVLHTCVCAMV